VERLGRSVDGLKPKFMDKSQWQISRGFVKLLLVFFLLWLVAEFLFPANNLRTKAMIIKTRSDERLISTLLGEQAGKTGGLTNLNQQFILDLLLATNQNQFWLNTNAAGEVIDIWQTPYRIALVRRTNFIISSAGPNRKFGDKDDIIFNSVSNDFVKP
jgi:hypothetical protein